MGKKIPGRKHRGVRDPEKQRTQRLSKIKDKVNAPPSHADDQPIPKSALRIAELMKKTENPLGYVKKNIKQKKRPKKAKNLVRVYTKVKTDEKPIAKFEQKKGESDNAFLYRVNQICESVKREAAFETKYGVDVKRDAETGKVMGIVKRQKDPLELILKSVKRVKKENNLKKKNEDSEGQETSKLTKSQKRRLKLKEKKMIKETCKLNEFNDFCDSVKFGEVIHAPPNLVAPKMVSKNNKKARPGEKPLLLKSLINKNAIEPRIKEPVEKSASFMKGITHKVIDRKGKRKDLPNALRRQLEKQQQEIIEVYKSIKGKKRNRS